MRIKIMWTKCSFVNPYALFLLWLATVVTSFHPIAQASEGSSKVIVMPAASEETLVQSIFVLRYLSLMHLEDISSSERRVIQDVVEEAIYSLSNSTSRTGIRALVDLSSIYVGDAAMGMLLCELQKKGKASKSIIIENRRSSNSACLNYLKRISSVEPKSLDLNKEVKEPIVCLDLTTFHKILDEQLKVIEQKKTPACGS